MNASLSAPMTRRTFALVAVLSLGSWASADEPKPIRVVVWDERQPKQKEAYDNFLGNEIAAYLKKQPGLVVTSVGLDDPEQGLSTKVIDNADVLIWWGHVRHGEIKPETAKKLVARIKEGKLSLVALHSAHFAMPFKEAMNERARTDVQNVLASLGEKARAQAQIKEKPGPAGLTPISEPLTPNFHSITSGGVLIGELTLPGCAFPSVRDDAQPSHVKVLLPEHPLAKGIPTTFDIPRTEMYSSPFHVPKPDLSIFEEKWDKGESFTSGSYWKLGKGGVIYFRPGHESYPVFKQAEPLKFIDNAVRFLAK